MLRDGEITVVASKVLIVEDDPNAVELLRLYLGRDGHKVLVASDGLEGLRLAREAHPDLVVLDLMLPKLDGMEVCRVLREESDVPIVMLTARVDEEDRLKGLNLGADDYVTKPFSPRELAARVRAVLRRTARNALNRGPAKLSYGDVKVDLQRRSAHVAGEKVTLTPTEFRILSMFIRDPSMVFTRDQIIERVFDLDFDGFDRTVDTHISNLRRRLQVDPGKPRYIHTIYGVGYRFGDE